MGNVRKALHICRGSFKRELVSPRIYIAFLWFLFLIYFIVSVIRSFGVSVGLRTSPWLLPLLTQQSGNQMFIIIGALLIFCDAPFLHANSGWQILRAGRKNWFWGNMLYIWGMSLFYALVLAIIPIILLIPHVATINSWGQVLGSLAQTNAASQLGIGNLCYDIMSQYEPIEAMILTILPIWLNSVLIGMVNYTFNLYGKNGSGAVVSIALGLSPLMLTKLASPRIAYYIAPPLWMNLYYYSKDGYGVGPSFGYVYAVLMGLIAVLTIFSYLGIRRKDLNMVEEI